VAEERRKARHLGRILADQRAGDQDGDAALAGVEDQRQRGGRLVARPRTFVAPILPEPICAGRPARKAAS
jgi:hypothetical protein